MMNTIDKFKGKKPVDSSKLVNKKSQAIIEELTAKSSRKIDIDKKQKRSGCSKRKINIGKVKIIWWELIEQSIIRCRVWGKSEEFRRETRQT